MAKEKYKRTPYVHQEWPKMFYHPVTGDYVTCAGEADVPEGFVNNIKDCESPPVGTNEPSRCTNMDVPDKYRDKKGKKAEPKKAASKPDTSKPAAKKVEKPADKDDEDDDEIVTLESLELSRNEAIELLDEAKVKFKKNASNDTIAGLVADLLED